MPKALANIYVNSSTLFSGLIFEDEMICVPRTARYVVRNQAETAEDAKSTSEHHRIQQYAIFRFNFEDEMICIPRTARYVIRLKHEQQKMPKARANIYAYSSTRFSGLNFEDEIICIPRTARYVVRNQAETAEDAESTSEHQRIQQYAIFRISF